MIPEHICTSTELVNHVIKAVKLVKVKLRNVAVVIVVIFSNNHQKDALTVAMNYPIKIVRFVTSVLP